MAITTGSTPRGGAVPRLRRHPVSRPCGPRPAGWPPAVSTALRRRRRAPGRRCTPPRRGPVALLLLRRPSDRQALLRQPVARPPTGGPSGPAPTIARPLPAPRHAARGRHQAPWLGLLETWRRLSSRLLPERRSGERARRSHGMRYRCSASRCSLQARSDAYWASRSWFSGCFEGLGRCAPDGGAWLPAGPSSS